MKTFNLIHQKKDTVVPDQTKFVSDGMKGDWDKWLCCFNVKIVFLREKDYVYLILNWIQDTLKERKLQKRLFFFKKQLAQMICIRYNKKLLQILEKRLR